MQVSTSSGRPHHSSFADGDLQKVHEVKSEPDDSFLFDKSKWSEMMDSPKEEMECNTGTFWIF